MAHLNSKVIRRIDEAVERNSLLDHPFYVAWSRGELSLPVLRGYARQYWHNVNAFPTYLSAVHANCPDLQTRQIILQNLMDEELGPENHPELWLRFAEGLGDDRREVISSRPGKETLQLIETFRQLTGERPFVEGLTALYCYESQVPAVARTKLLGLRDFYGITDPRATQFFTLHESLDVGHSAQEAAIIAHYAEDYDPALILSTAVKALAAQWQFLDGMMSALDDDHAS